MMFRGSLEKDEIASLGLVKLRTEEIERDEVAFNWRVLSSAVFAVDGG